MACSLDIPDDFPGGWAISACQQSGTFLGIDIYRDTLPRFILNKTKDDACKVTPTSMLGVIFSSILNGLSVFFLLVLLFPDALSPGSLVWWMWMSTILGLMILAPGIMVITYYIASISGAFKEKEDTTGWLLVAFIMPMLVYAGILINFIMSTIFTDVSTAILSTLFVLIGSTIAKSLFPVAVLLLGPGVIPVISGTTFLEYCTA